MGKAIIIDNIDFSSVGIGQVTPLQEINLIGITISEGTTRGNEVTMNATYNPSNTTFRQLTWSIESGSEYATISNNGVITVLEGANNSPVVVKAVSNIDSSIYDTTTVYLTYDDTVIEEYDGLVFDGASGIDTGILVLGSHKIEIEATLNFGTYTYKTVPIGMLLGGRDSRSSNRRDIQHGGNGNVLTISFGIGDISSDFSTGITTPIKVLYRSNPTLVSANSQQRNVSIPNFTCSVNYFVGCNSQIETPQDYYFCYDTVHYLKIWDANENLVAHFVPATKNGVAGLYNKVGLTFHGNEFNGNLTVI